MFDGQHIDALEYFEIIGQNEFISRALEYFEILATPMCTSACNIYGLAVQDESLLAFSTGCGNLAIQNLRYFKSTTVI